MTDDRNFHVVEPLEARPLRGRRGWTDEAKARLIEESLVPGANVSAIARRVGIAASQLFGWRRKALSSGQVQVVGQEPAGAALQFARVEVKPSGGQVEVVIGDIVVRAEVGFDPEHLARVIRAVRQA
jgi:transposase